MPWPWRARARGRNIENFGDGEQLPKLRAGCLSHSGVPPIRPFTIVLRDLARGLFWGATGAVES
jgi:hypothetical protein